MDEIHELIIRMSSTWFDMREVTPDSIHEYIDRMKRAYPESTLNEDYLFSRLESLHTVSISGDPSTLEDTSDHEEWFNPDTNAALNRDLTWHYWEHYREYLLRGKSWNRRVVDGLDRLSSLILSKMEDPHREGTWDRRGVVVGSVQSGKTANYTALITKAADAGYKLIVILAGVHNSLRSQTQYRLNEEFLGYDLQTIQQITGHATRIGVGSMFRDDHRQVITLTHSGEDGDFRRDIRTRAGIMPSVDGPPMILIIKKNVSIMRNLIEWISDIIGIPDHEGNRIVPDVPFLLVDDECDYASVNTRNPDRDENGQIIREWEPARTNQRIRQLLNIFRKSVYVGYSATPFANIFIHHDDPHPDIGEDLFPRSFIISLPQPTNYIGPDRLFGIDDNIDTDIEDVNPLPLIRIVDDHEDDIPSRHRTDLNVADLPDSMKNAIKSFLLVCAARTLRREGTPHNSMLIHVTRYTMVQRQIHELVTAELNVLTARIMSGSDPLEDFRDLWESDFLSTSASMEGLGFADARRHPWEDIKRNLYETTRRIRVRLLNGLSTDTLEYRDAEIHARNQAHQGITVAWEDRGASVIAIGGDKLSRGLTLDGLSISYYLRVSTMYDTLMQMGRWFGYRDGYNDLCRIYTLRELSDYYRFIAGAMLELKNELNYMALQNTDPLNFGLRIRNHPGRLAVTSAQKSRDAERIRISFEGRSQETIVFDPQQSGNNINALETIITRLNPVDCEPVGSARPRYHWKGVPSGAVTMFLRDYRTHDDAMIIVNPERHADYIERQNTIDELTEWDVVIISHARPEQTFISASGIEIGCVTRNALDITDNKISIRRLLSPADQLLDLSDSELREARRRDGLDIEGNRIPRPETIRRVRPARRGLMLIYLCHGRKDDRSYGRPGEEVIGYGLSFPASSNAIPTDFIVNPVYVDQLFE